ncbi:hypothetical protein [Streptomyces sp. 891-h]|uniref:hypothetical protein n=1 Tax=Streptomyces sp. 891-h TaxID=2720714 RepID=UPI001FA9F8EF|nr:hypothetical protein [Streptomyces sp. 891-h]UNZ19071.1 hypothetical protein HC362_20495 [Streptomyces sp. 891-h]
MSGELERLERRRTTAELSEQAERLGRQIDEHLEGLGRRPPPPTTPAKRHQSDQ